MIYNFNELFFFAKFSHTLNYVPDLVVSDVHMPDMDGFRLLELIGLELDLPVIMMSANGETQNVLK